jgi:hypothetical protein
VRVDERAKEFVRDMKSKFFFGRDVTLGQMIWSVVEQAYKMGYAQAVEDAGMPARRGNEHP